MPNHYHFLIRVKDQDQIKQAFDKKQDSKVIREYLDSSSDLNDLIQDQFRRFHSSYSLKYHNKYKSRGQLFMNRHKRVGVDEEKKLKYLICYIHHNPIHHGFTKQNEDWNYLSYHAISSDLPTQISRDAVLTRFGGIERFLEEHENFKLEKKLDIER